MSDINTTPLVDVMLVLLIIFLITVPVVLQTVPVELPKVALRSDRDQAGERLPVGARRARRHLRGLLEPDPGRLTKNCSTARSRSSRTQIKRVGGVENITEENMPEAHIRGDINTPYKCIGGAIFTMQRAGFARVGFISEPPPGMAVTAAVRKEPSPWRCKPLATNVEGEPMMEINTTPLIDVMLVLLIMFIITIPVQTHAVKLDLPQNNPNDTPPPVDPVKNKLVDHARAMRSCGTARRSTWSQLRQYLDVTQQMNPVPELHLQPEPEARYELVDEVLAVTKQAHVSKMGFVGNEAYMKASKTLLA